MMLLILDRNPVKSALLVPDKLKFKQLLELAQMISTITGSVYKPVRQGKEIQEWIKNILIIQNSITELCMLGVLKILKCEKKQ